MLKNKRQLLIVQPYLTAYRLPVFADLTKHWTVHVVSSPTKKQSGYGEAHSVALGIDRHTLVPEHSLFDGAVLYQSGLVQLLWRERPDVVICSANRRSISYWLMLFIGRLLRVPVYSWGHGLFKKKHVTIIDRALYRLITKLSKIYICYTPVVQSSLKQIGIRETKLSVAENSLVNAFPVRPNEKTGQEKGILFIGRLRPGSDLDLLIHVITRLREKAGVPLRLHIIGDGEESTLVDRLNERLPWIVWYRQVYQQEQIQAISRECLLGCYPGNAGLSVVHMMSLSLPPVIHNNNTIMMGPEPSYVRDGDNGFLFSYSNREQSLYETLLSVVSAPARISHAQKAAYETYEQLIKPTLAERLAMIIEG